MLTCRLILLATMVIAIGVCSCGPRAETNEPKLENVKTDNSNKIGTVTEDGPDQRNTVINIEGVDPGDTVYLFVDGRFDTRDVYDSAFIATGPMISIGKVGPLSTHDPCEVVGFTKGHPPCIHRVDWDSVADAISIKFDSLIEIKVAIWLLHDEGDGTHMAARLRALRQIELTNAILSNENVGVRLIPDTVQDIIDHTQNGKNITSGTWQNIYEVMNFLDTIGKAYKHNVINIFYLGDVELPTDADGTVMRNNEKTEAAIFLSRYALDDLLIHELGHICSLGHSDDNDCKTIITNSTNVMRGKSFNRWSVTEGQVLRAIRMSNSCIKKIYKMSSADPIENCECGFTSSQCMNAAKSVWADILPTVRDIANPIADCHGGDSVRCPRSEGASATTISPDVLKALDTASARRYEVVYQRLQFGNSTYLSMNDRTALLAVTKDMYIRRERKRYEMKAAKVAGRDPGT